MTSAKQRASNKVNALRSTGPRSDEGKRRAGLNATKHRLSLPVDERAFGKEIEAVSRLVRDECSSDDQAVELAKRIIDFERNETFLLNFSDEDVKNDIQIWGRDPYRLELIRLVQMHTNKQPVPVTFTTSNKRPKGKERTDEIKYIEGFLKLQDRVLLGKVRHAEQSQISALRYQKRAINQLVKGLKQL
jgi:hypothetical protein